MTTAKFTRSLLAKLFFIFLISVKAIPLYSQVYGCKDPLANNYNAAATVNDGTCTYNVTSYLPPSLISPIDATLIETSGLQMAGNFLWSFNDGGGAAAIYRVDTLTGTVLQTVNLSGATNVDWEDIAFDGSYFYVGDFGNNTNGARTDLKIYKFSLSSIDTNFAGNPIVTIPSGQIEIIDFTYSDQPLPITATTPNNTKYDCEAMIVDGGQIHLFTKNWIDLNTTHYVINGVAAGTYVATPLETLATTYLVTGADKAVGQNIVALLGYKNVAPANHYMHLLTDYSGGNYFNGNKRRIDLPNATVMGQAEGITFRDGTYGYISNEKFTYAVCPVVFTVNQGLRSFNTSSFVPLYVLPLTLQNFTASKINGTHKITWSFDDVVENVQVQYSTDGLNFTILKTYNNSLTGTFYNNTTNTDNYYRISWQKNNGAIQYSNIIRIKNEEKNLIGNFLLRNNGELTFTLNGSTSQYYKFELATADGRILSRTAPQSYIPGLNKVYVSKNPVSNSVVFLIVYNNNQRTTTALHVEK